VAKITQRYIVNSQKTPYPYIRITDFKGHKIDLSNIMYVDEDTQKVISKYTVNKQDIILSIVGTLGLCAIVPNELDNANLTENCVKLAFDKTKIDTKFLYYHLISPDTQELIKSLDVGSTQPKLPLYNIKKIDTLLPPLPEQKAIADVLSSIDDKIELLHRQNKTLEEMAMTLFRQWFIEPTRDGLPEGWEEVSLGEIFDIGIGRTPPRKESYWFSLNPKDIRWISVKDLGSIDTYIINTSEFLKEEAVKKFNIPIIPDNTVLLSFKLTVGRIGITIGEMVSNEAIAHFKLKPNSKISSNYLYCF
jgi:Restriction endonuclease S subunits